MDFFKNEPFGYNRSYAPMFFRAPHSKEEADRMQERMQQASREYFRVALTPGSTYRTDMPSLGCQLGEYAMFLVVQRKHGRKSV